MKKLSDPPPGYVWLDSSEMIDLATATAAMGDVDNARRFPQAFRYILGRQVAERAAKRDATEKRRLERAERHAAIARGDRQAISILSLASFYEDERDEPVMPRRAAA